MKISAQDWRLLFERLDQYIEADAAEREAVLSRTDQESGLIGEHLRRLIRNMDMDQPTPTAHLLGGLPAFPGSRFAADGQVGPYRLIREIGRGGMSAVWLAERSDGVMRRFIALKLPSVSTHDTEFLNRFTREREILASLTHPHIARLYDAGFDAQGQPYLAMEYIEGTSLLKYAETQRLNTSERIELFVQTLSAVSYAHGRLVIHRDLKPSNILVDASGRVHLLDFGIAKLLVSNAPMDAELTHMGRALTPDYASPEQILGESLSIATDVYSAGVVLFEFLSGSRPYKLVRDTHGALEEAILSAQPSKLPDTIREGQPEACRVNRAALARELTGDLDAIVQKALKKEPALRYASADAFALDLQRYLRHEPIQARPDSLWYRARQFGRRNWLGLSAVSAVFAALIIGTVVASSQARHARLEARRADAVQNFLLNLFAANSADQADPAKARQTTAEELLDAGAKHVAEDLKDSPEAQVRVLETLGDMYYELGLEDRSSDMHGQRLKILKRLYGENDDRVVQATMDYAMNLEESSRHAQAEAPIKEAKAVLDARGDTSSPLRGRLLLQMARFYRLTDAGASRDYADAAVAILSRSDPNDNLTESLRYASMTRRALDDWEGADQLAAQAEIAVAKRHPGEDAWRVTPLCEHGEIEARLFLVEAAERDLRACVALQTRLNGPDHPETQWTQVRLAAFLQSSSRSDEAHRLFREIRAHSPGNAPPPSVFVAGSFARADYLDGRPDIATAEMTRYIADLRAQYPGSGALASGQLQEAQLLTVTGRYAEAQAAWSEALDILHQVGGGQLKRSAENTYWLVRARLELAQGDASAALTDLDRLRAPEGRAMREQDARTAQVIRARVALVESPGGGAVDAVLAGLNDLQHSALREYEQTFEAELELTAARALLSAGDPTAARPHAEHAVALRQRNEDRQSIWTAEAQIALADCLIATHAYEEARLLLTQASAALTQDGAADHSLGAALRSSIASLKSVAHLTAP
jgi:eukaryotic-like serine/threonine-protein kinase